ncbi:hypothetical protein AB0N05_07510 [Nocardia sp. NPDC051030]|uniref:hypothetical protein n=1 Tax=Nocardia sp. NPDC051030 TaxID=3155162 RepID=UPI0034134449
MFRVLELLGLCAPLVGAGLALYYRRRLGGAFPYAMAAAALALIGSGVAVVSDHVRWFGGDSEGIVEHMEIGSGLRNVFLIGAWVLLLVAIGRSRNSGVPQ